MAKKKHPHQDAVWPADIQEKEAKTIRISRPSRNTDMATILGLVFALGLIVAALAMGGKPGAFLNGPALLIVLFGTMAVTAISFSPGEFAGALQIAGKSLSRHDTQPARVARELLDLSSLAKRRGPLALQWVEKELRKNPFLAKGAQMVMDGLEGDEIEAVMGLEIESLLHRHQKGANILRRAAEVAPAMGLIGTLVGLVQMLAGLDDPSSIGPGMAVALLTTFYGAILGTVIFSPLAAKLERNSRYEAGLMELVLHGIVSIARQENPRRLEVLLNSELPPTERLKYFD